VQLGHAAHDLLERCHERGTCASLSKPGATLHRLDHRRGDLKLGVVVGFRRHRDAHQLLTSRAEKSSILDHRRHDIVRAELQLDAIANSIEICDRDRHLSQAYHPDAGPATACKCDSAARSKNPARAPQTLRYRCT